MKKLFIVAATVLVVGILAIGSKEKVQRYSVEKYIEQAKYCSVDQDCVLAEPTCPFGCFIAVNKNEVSEVNRRLRAFSSTCAYSCVELRTLSCVHNRCVAAY